MKLSRIQIRRLIESVLNEGEDNSNMGVPNIVFNEKELNVSGTSGPPIEEFLEDPGKFYKYINIKKLKNPNFEATNKKYPVRAKYIIEKFEEITQKTLKYVKLDTSEFSKKPGLTLLVCMKQLMDERGTPEKKGRARAVMFVNAIKKFIDGLIINPEKVDQLMKNAEKHMSDLGIDKD